MNIQLQQSTPEIKPICTSCGTYATALPPLYSPTYTIRRLRTKFEGYYFNRTSVDNSFSFITVRR